MTTPTPGQPLSEADVSLLQPGDRLKWRAEHEHYGTFLHRMDDVSAGICWYSDTYNRKHYSPGFMMEFVKRPAPPKEDLGDGVLRDVEPDEAYRPHAPVSRPAGFLAGLTDDQRKEALLHTGDDTHPIPTGEGAWDRVRVEIEKAFAEGITPDEILSLFQPQPTAGEGEREAVARITGDDLHEILASFKDRADVEEIAAKINERLSLLRPAAPDAGGGEAWAWLASKPSMELSYSWGDEDEDGGWQVHECRGGRSDREWTLIASGETPLEAVQKAKAALQPGGER